MSNMDLTYFAPQLYIKSGITDIDFYIKGLGAIELRRFINDDGTVHVAELSINGAIFHLHEESEKKGLFAPDKMHGATAIIGLFVEDVDFFMERSKAAGAIEISPVQDYDYGYRQGEIKDPLGHHWMFEARI